MLAASALGMVAASSGAVLLIPGPAEDTVPVPEITSAAEQQQAPTPAGQQQAPAPAEPVASAGPGITGAQIAALALGPARDRAAALIEAQARAEAEQASDDDDSDARGNNSERWRELRDELREACEDGRIRGQICRTS